MERRKDARKRRRLVCDLLVSGVYHAGRVADLSSTGLFVETQVSAPRGENVMVRIRELDGPPLELHAAVAHRLRIRNRGHSRQGLGLHLAGAVPERYAELVREAPARHLPRSQTFRVHVKDPDTRDVRSFEVAAESEFHAAENALAALGEEWDLVEVETL